MKKEYRTPALERIDMIDDDEICTTSDTQGDWFGKDEGYGPPARLP